MSKKICFPFVGDTLGGSHISSLELIKGIGLSKRSALLNHFGGLQEVQNASVDELQKVVGINSKLATKINESFKK